MCYGNRYSNRLQETEIDSLTYLYVKYYFKFMLLI